MKTAKRFYTSVTTAKADNGFEVRLDGRPLKTPQKHNLFVTSEAVAEFIAAEWEAQQDTINPENMPITRLVNVSIELTPKNRDRLSEEARRYAATDLLCYRADDPLSLAERQAELWDPMLIWAAERGIKLETTDSLIAIDQPKTSLAKVKSYAASQNDLDLTLFVHLIAVFGSAILAMAVMERFITGQKGFTLSRLDNLYQIEQWGEDEEAAEIAAKLEAEVAALCKILEV